MRTSAAAGDAKAYWQVDLGADMNVDAVEVVTRWALDQPETRRSFRVLGSSDPTFAPASRHVVVRDVVVAHLRGAGRPRCVDAEHDVRAEADRQ